MFRLQKQTNDELLNSGVVNWEDGLSRQKQCLVNMDMVCGEEVAASRG